MENSITKLQYLAFGIIALAIIIGVGIIILNGIGNVDVHCTSGMVSVSVINESGFINRTGYTLTNSTAYGFTTPVLTALYNRTDGLPIVLANASVSATGIVKNATVEEWNGTLISYTYIWDNTHTFNTTTQTCLNATGGDAETGAGTTFTTTTAIVGYLGTGSGGLASWIPIVIVLVIGMMFLGYFMSKKKEKY